MKKNTAKKTEQKDESKQVYVYQDIYDGLATVVGDPAILVQPFVLTNNADIVKAIDFWRNELTKVSDNEKLEIESIIQRYKNIMKLRISMTEDLMSEEAPHNFIFGPKIVSKTKTEEKKVKTIQHPASKKNQTVNEKLGEEKDNKDKKEQKESNTDKNAPSYLKLYPIEKDQIDNINDVLIPNLQKYLSGDKKNLENARKTCQIHFKNYGTNVHFCNDTQVMKLISWLQSGYFQSRSPLAILNNEPLSIKEIISETERLVIEGMERRKIRSFLAPYIINVPIKDMEKTISTERDYVDFFQRSLQYLFDEDQLRKLKSTAAQQLRTRDTIKKELYEIHKDSGKCVFNMSKELLEWLTEQDEKTNLKTVRAETLAFLKSHDSKMYDEYFVKTGKGKEKSSDGDKTNASKAEVKEEIKQEDKKDTVEESKETDTTSPVVFPKLEEQLQYQDKKSLLTTWLLTIVNKHIMPIGTRVDGIDKQVEDLTKLAKKRILEMGLKEEDGKIFDDWTEKDVLQYMAEEVVPFITDEYGILQSRTDDELKSHLEFYLQKYPAGEEKAREKTLKEVAASSIPRDNHMKGVTRKIRKGNFKEINILIKEINNTELEKAKEEIKDK